VGEHFEDLLARKRKKKIVGKFTARQGLWMALMVGGAMVGMLLLFLLGFFHVD
jgi:hypothetical protein